MEHLVFTQAVLLIALMTIALVIYTVRSAYLHLKSLIIYVGNGLATSLSPSNVDSRVAYALLIAMPLLASLFLFWVYRMKNPRPKKAPEREKEIEIPNWLWLTSGWTYFVLMIGFMVGDFWWGKLFSGMGVAFVVGFTLYGYMMYHDPKKPFRYTLGVMCTWVMAGMLLWYLGGPWATAKYEAWANTLPPSPAVIPTSTPGINTSLTPDPKAVVKKTISEIVFARIPPDEAIQLVARAEAESGFTQWNPDGTIFRGQVNPHDVCAFQINTDYWGAEAQQRGLDLNTIEGCTEMALVIYEKDGLSAWNTLKGVTEVNKTVKIIEAPVGTTIADGTSETIYISKNNNCHGVPDKLVIAWDDNNQPHEVTPTKIPSFYTKTLRYSTPEGPPAKVTYGCTR